MKRLISFLFIFAIFQFIPWYAFAVLAIAYAYYWRAYELLILGILIDAFYGTATVVPYYTLITGVPVILFEWLKPELLFYTK